MAYNQYTPATTAYVEAAFKEYDAYIRERLSSDEKSIEANTANIMKILDAIGCLSIVDGAVNQTYEIGD